MLLVIWNYQHKFVFKLSFVFCCRRHQFLWKHYKLLVAAKELFQQKKFLYQHFTLRLMFNLPWPFNFIVELGCFWMLLVIWNYHFNDWIRPLQVIQVVKHVCIWLFSIPPRDIWFHLYRGIQFYWWRNTEYQEKITNMSVTKFIT
jgi:hypothetical protein